MKVLDLVGKVFVIGALIVSAGGGVGFVVGVTVIVVVAEVLLIGFHVIREPVFWGGHGIPEHCGALYVLGREETGWT